VNKLMPLLGASHVITGNAADWDCKFAADRSTTIDATGNFTVSADASGDINHSKVAGTVQVPAR
jgi:hypothetical protein